LQKPQTSKTSFCTSCKEDKNKQYSTHIFLSKKHTKVAPLLCASRIQIKT